MELLGTGGMLSVAVTLMESRFLGGSQSCDSAQVKEHSANLLGNRVVWGSVLLQRSCNLGQWACFG